MKQKATCPNGRQHINLSQYAYDVIRNDSLTFLGILNISGFINTIVENVKVDSFDDISLIEEERIKAELSDYSNSKKALILKQSELDIIHKIAVARFFHELNSSKKYQKNVSLKIKLNKKLHNEFYPNNSDWDGEKYNLSQGEYIKSIIEAYARKTYYERESVFYKERIEDFNTMLSTSDSEKKILSISLKDERKLYCKPYRLSEEYETSCHYLIGLFAKEGDSEFTIASIRLSRIAEIKARGKSFGSGKISGREIKSIEKRIKESGIPYLLGKPEQYIIKLTKMGMTLYDYKSSERPVYDELIFNDQEESYTMKITATRRQIKNYFLAFGKEAIIISPNETRLWLKEKYNDAFCAYDSN